MGKTFGLLPSTRMQFSDDVLAAQFDDAVLQFGTWVEGALEKFGSKTIGSGTNERHPNDREIGAYFQKLLGYEEDRRSAPRTPEEAAARKRVEQEEAERVKRDAWALIEADLR